MFSLAQYAPGPYINLAVYYYKYGQLNKPAVVDCHVTTRLTNLLQAVGEALRETELLDLTNDISVDIRRDELLQMIRTYGIPWLGGGSRSLIQRGISWPVGRAQGM